MALILGLDVETQGLDATKDRVTEWGLVLWDSFTKQPVRISGFLVKVPGGVSTEIEKLTGITNEMLEVRRRTGGGDQGGAGNGRTGGILLCA